jgi:hypothetical protein
LPAGWRFAKVVWPVVSAFTSLHRPKKSDVLTTNRVPTYRQVTHCRPGRGAWRR